MGLGHMTSEVCLALTAHDSTQSFGRNYNSSENNDKIQLALALGFSFKNVDFESNRESYAF